MPKSSKRFVLSNETLNSHGFRIITAGIDLTSFIKNPIMYWLHEYPEGDAVKKNLPIGYWDEIRIEGDLLTAVPVFDDNDDFALKIYYKVEHGTIRSASVAVNPITVDGNRSNWVQGQKLPTVLTSTIDEASIVDRGSNADAVTLNDGRNKILLKLDESKLTPKVKNTIIDEDSEHTPETLAIMDNAVACGKFTKSQAKTMLSLAATDPSTLNALKGVIRTTTIKPDNIEGKFHHTLIKQAAENSYDDIERKIKGGFMDLKANAPELYKAKFFEKHGRLPAVI